MQFIYALDARTCLNQLTETVIGRLAFISDGIPAVEPATYLLHEDVVIILERDDDTVLPGNPQPCPRRLRGRPDRHDVRRRLVRHGDRPRSLDY